VPPASVLIATYNQPQWLEWTLWGYSAQGRRDFEVIVVDDGSREDTRALIDRLRTQMPFPLRHFWQPDEGYQKCKAMNRAILLAESDYLIFTDGDCIPRADFVEWHLRLREPGRFLSGGYAKLPRALSDRITREDILCGRATDYRWLRANGLDRHSPKLWLGHPRVRAFANLITRVEPRFHGHNSSAWREDVSRVNGWDERMQYGGQDIELGMRLTHAGVRGKTIRYSAICVHLDHDRSYVRPDMRARNDVIRAETRRSRSAWTPFGIDAHRGEPLSAT